MEAHEAVCRECDWAELYPQREMAEHAKRVHEDRYGHGVVLEKHDDDASDTESGRGN